MIVKGINYWWVNHKQTYGAEIAGGYVWSPKKEKNGAHSQFYTNLTLVEPCDIIFSYANSKIMAVGVAADFYREQSKPVEFGTNGMNWSDMGWLVSVCWQRLSMPFSPKEHINVIKPLLPATHSPIRENGVGNQKCYLAKISKSLADSLFSFIEQQNLDISYEIINLDADIKADIQQHMISKSSLEYTYKEQLIKARLGQGIFRQNVMSIEPKCRLTDIPHPAFLIASHIKPWRHSNNSERLDGHNGLLLSPHVDKLFDKGCISFSDEGFILITTSQVKELMHAWGLNTQCNVGAFTEQQKRYLAYHREYIFSRSIPTVTRVLAQPEITGSSPH